MMPTQIFEARCMQATLAKVALNESVAWSTGATTAFVTCQHVGAVHDMAR